MPFRNYSLTKNGQLTIGQILSPDYVAGVSGWEIRKDGSAEFNDITIRGGQVVGGTALYYDGTPGPGNLIVSVSESGGTDEFGNVYPSGIASMNGGITANLTNGTLSITPITGGFSPALFTAFTGMMILTSPTETNTDQLAQLLVTSAAAYAAASAAMVVGPAGIKVTVPIAADTWHPITLDTGWTAGPQVPQYRRLPDGNIQVRGQATHASMTAGTNINNSNPLTTAYQPAANRFYKGADPSDSAGAIFMSTAGVLGLRASTTFPATTALLDGIYSI